MSNDLPGPPCHAQEPTDRPCMMPQLAHATCDIRLLQPESLEHHSAASLWSWPLLPSGRSGRLCCGMLCRLCRSMLRLL